MTSQLANIVIYSSDPPRLARFWAGVFHYTPWEWQGPLLEAQLAAGLSPADLQKRALIGPEENAEGPRFVFRHANGPRHERNRLHLDLLATPGRAPSREELDSEKDRLVALGAEVIRLIDQPWGALPELYYQLRDPEGNEFCLQ